jgi:adenylate cyclase
VIDRGLSRDADDRFPSMTALVDELERKLAVGSLPIPDKPSIAVLPFHNLSRDPEQEHFADGVVESITAVLSRIRSFFVISRNSAFQYRSRDRNPRDIGRELGVAYLLDGSVQRVGTRVRITVQLIEAATGVQLWADKYDGTLDEVFDLQDRITAHVAGALQPSIRHAEIERARRKRPVELGAYDYTMRAMHHVWHLEKAEAARGLELLDHALAVDPSYPLGLALKAWCLAQHSVYNWIDNAASVLADAVRLADTAANLSTDDPVVLAVLGTVHTFARNHGVARVMLERAVSLDPNNAWAISRLGWLDVYADQPESAVTNFERALRLSPFDPMNFNNYVGLASAKQVTGDDNAAADLFLRALQERPNALWIHRNLAPALHGADRTAEAMASRDAMLAAYPELTLRKFKSAMVFSPRVLARISDQLRALGIPDGES